MNSWSCDLIWTRNSWMWIRGFERVTCGSGLVTYGFQFDLLNFNSCFWIFWFFNSQLVNRDLQLVTRNSCFTISRVRRHQHSYLKSVDKVVVTRIGKSLTILTVLGFTLIYPLGIPVKLDFTSYVLLIIFQNFKNRFL